MNSRSVSSITASVALAFAALLGAEVVAGSDAPLDVLDACIAHLDDTHEDTEYTAQWPEIREACPELEAALADSEYAPWLPEAWRDRAKEDPTFITLEGLIELERLLAAERELRAARTVSVDSLPGVLDGLDRTADTPKVTWWDSLLEWLRERTPRRQGGDAGWLGELLNELGRYETLLRLLGYGLFAAIVVLSLGIVVNEMRLAGVFEARVRWPAKPAALAVSEEARSSPQTERFAALIDRILVALATDRGVSLDSSATHRELARAVQLPNDDERTSFVRLLDCAERVRYAAVWPPDHEIDGALDAGASLLSSIHRRSSRDAKPG